MEITVESVQEALKTNPELGKTLFLTLAETEAGKEILENKSKAYFDANIGTKVSEIYNNLDNDIFETLGVRKKPEQKTYEFLKTDVLAKLKKLEEDASKDDKAVKIKELESTVEKLKQSSTNDEFWKKTHEQAVLKFEADKNELQSKLQEIEKSRTIDLVNNDLSKGLAGLNFNPNIPKSAIDALTETIKGNVMKNSKIENGKVIYLNEDGTPMLDKEYKPITSQSIFAEQLKDVLAENPNVGGQAPTGKKGEIISVKTGDVNTKKLVLDKTQFSTRMEFFNVLEKTLLEQGIEKTSKDFAELRDNAYVEYEVEKLNRV